MADKLDVKQGTLALMILKTIDVLFREITLVFNESGKFGELIVVVDNLDELGEVQEPALDPLFPGGVGHPLQAFHMLRVRDRLWPVGRQETPQ